MATAMMLAEQMRQENLAEQPPRQPDFFFALPNGARIDSRVVAARQTLFRLSGREAAANPAGQAAFERVWKSSNPYRGISDPLGGVVSFAGPLRLVLGASQPVATAKTPESFLDQLVALYLVQARSNSRQCIVLGRSQPPFIGTYAAPNIPPIDAIVAYNHAANRLPGGIVQDAFKNTVPDDSIDSLYFLPHEIAASVFSAQQPARISFVAPDGASSNDTLVVDAQTYERLGGAGAQHQQYYAVARKLPMALEIHLVGGSGDPPSRNELPRVVQPGVVVARGYRVGFVLALVQSSRTMWKSEPTEAAVVHPSYPLSIQVVSTSNGGVTDKAGYLAGDAWVWPEPTAEANPIGSAAFFPAYDTAFPIPLVQAAVVANRPISARERFKWISLDGLRGIQYLPTAVPNSAKPGLVARYRNFATERWRYDPDLRLWIDVYSLTPTFVTQEAMERGILSKMPGCITCYLQDLAPLNINRSYEYDCADSVRALRDISPAECTLEYVLCSLPDKGDEAWGLSREQVRDLLLEYWYPFARGDWAYLSNQKIGGGDGDALYALLAIANKYVMPDGCVLTEAAARMASYMDGLGSEGEEGANTKRQRLNQAILVLINAYVPVILLGGSTPPSGNDEWVRAMTSAACPLEKGSTATKRQKRG